MTRIYAVVLLAGALTVGCSGSPKLNQNNAGGGNGPADTGKAGTSGGMQPRQGAQGSGSGQSGSADASGGTTSSGAAGNGTGISSSLGSSSSGQSGTNNSKTKK